MPPDATLRDIIKVLQQRELARVPIVDSSGKVVKMVSQSAVISFLSKHVRAHPKVSLLSLSFDLWMV
jgi:CBS-domain-containing membrane protein